MEVLNNIQIHHVKKANDTVGIKNEGDMIEIYVPQTFRIEEDNNKLKRDLILFLKSIAISKTLKYDSINRSNNEGACWPIESYLWIIRDYLVNGFFYNREKSYFHDKKGKIEWKRTLKNIPIISEGNLIYDKFITSRMSASNDIIAQIYKICLKQSQNRIGWLFGYKFHIDVNQVVSVQEMVHLIKKELSSTFDDIKRIRFKHMLAILKSIDHENALSNIFTYTIDNYYYVYEVMIDSLFNGIKGKEKQKYNPFGYWKLNNSEAVISSELRPDTIYKKENSVYVLDAKMYQYGHTHDVNDLPTTTSMQKQITYGDYIKNKIEPNAKVRNAFILPYDKEIEEFKNDINVIKYNDDNLAYIGEAFVNWRDSKSKQEHERIFTFLIDFNFLLNSYQSKDIDYISVLISQIDDLLKD